MQCQLLWHTQLRQPFPSPLAETAKPAARPAQRHVAKLDTEAEEVPLQRKMKRSPYILAINMLLECGNLMSTTLYAMEAYQRATLVSYSAPCGPGTLMPVHCSVETDIF